MWPLKAIQGKILDQSIRYLKNPPTSVKAHSAKPPTNPRLVFKRAFKIIRAQQTVSILTKLSERSAAKRMTLMKTAAKHSP